MRKKKKKTGMSCHVQYTIKKNESVYTEEGKGQTVLKRYLQQVNRGNKADGAKTNIFSNNKQPDE